MKIGVLGDVHGRVLHALAVLAHWQIRNQTHLDLILQAGDLGAWPVPARADEATRHFATLDSGEFDFRRLLDADPETADALSRVRRQLGQPIQFVRGNHDDAPWLHTLGSDQATPAAADPFGLFHYVADGTVRQDTEIEIAFLGGIDAPPGSPVGLDEAAYAKLFQLPAGTVDLLVTHEGPWGLARNRQGEVRGSRRISALLDTLRPAFHVFGHHHEMIGPIQVGQTICIGLNQLVAPPREPPVRVLGSGSLGILDLPAGTFTFVRDEWLAEFGRRIDFPAIVRELNGE